MMLFSLCDPARADSAEPEGLAHALAGHSTQEILRQIQDPGGNPAMALQWVLPYWRTEAMSPADTTALGLVLMKDADSLDRSDDVTAIGQRLLGMPMSPLDRRRLLGLLAGRVDQLHDPARIHALEAEVGKLAQTLPDHQDYVADLWAQLSADYSILNLFPDSIRLARKAIATGTHHPVLADYRAWQVISLAYMHQGQIPEAIEALHSAEQASRQLKMPDDALLLSTFGVLYVYAGEWQKSIDYTLRAIAADHIAGRKIRIDRHDMFNNLGEAYSRLGDLDRAQAAFRQAIKLARQQRQSYAYPLNNLGEVLLKKRQPRQALPMFNQALDIFRRQGNVLAQATALANIASTQAELGRHAAAAGTFQQSLAMLDKTADTEERLSIYPVMIANLKALHRYRDALTAMEAYKQDSDQRNSVQTQTRVARMESVIDLEHQKRKLAEDERERIEQRTTIETFRNRNQQQRLWIGGMVIIVVAMLLVTVLIYAQNRLRRRLNRQLQTSNAELAEQRRHLAELNAEVTRQSEEDALTGLYNRRYGQALLQELNRQQLACLEQGRPRTPTLLVLLDIDHFKQINDIHGHDAGDRALLYFADALRSCSRADDILVRWGGEEFLWIIATPELELAEQLFSRLRQRLQAQPLQLPRDTLTLTASAGYGMTPTWAGVDSGWAVDLTVIDAALYRAKSTGRDRIVGFVGSTPPTVEVAVLSRIAAPDMLAHGWLVEYAPAGGQSVAMT
ncbi:tetratricopeptide repeat-containing diguanylate cyclase [Frateuria aurantia]